MQNACPKDANQWPEGRIAKQTSMQKHANKRAKRVLCMCLHSWGLQSVPPAIVLHLWNVFVCILVVLPLARPVWVMRLLTLKMNGGKLARWLQINPAELESGSRFFVFSPGRQDKLG